MGLENSGISTGKYIGDLNSGNPAATDPIAQADEHMRYIKGVLKNSFTGVTGEVSVTHTQINNKCVEPVSAITSDGANPAVVSLGANVTQAIMQTALGLTPTALIATTDTNGDVTPSITTGVTATEVWDLIKVEAFKTIYPLNSIYISLDSTDDASALNTRFGGTWEATGVGQVLVGVDPDDTGTDSFATGGTTGGAKTTTSSLSTTIPRDGWGNEQGGSNPNTLAEPTVAGRLVTGDGNIEVSEGFESLAHASGDRTFTGTATTTTVQPFLVVYMWKRTAL